MKLHRQIYRLKSLFRIPKKVVEILWDFRLQSTINVKEKGKKIFKIFDYGKCTRTRANTFEITEPETLRWINSFQLGSNFLDIGANIGLYSLYAAKQGVKVVAIEPDSLNFAMLNLNISINDFDDFITPYSIAIHDSTKFSKFFQSSKEWGGALNSFDNTLDQWGNNYLPVRSQGIYGISLDLLMNDLDFFPDYLKIDVDGNENLILQGAPNFLNCPKLKSILIELDVARKDYTSSIKLIKKAGFKLLEKTQSEIFNTGKFKDTFNHIFVR